MSGAKAAAVEYRENGWNPIPVKDGSKATSLAELAPYLERRATAEELRGWSWPGVGVVTGHVSEVLVLDVDGPEGEAELKKHGHPITPMARTPSGGLHLYFKHPPGDVRTGIRVAPGLDVKARGGYVVAPPTRGSNGKAYEWIVSPREADLADVPEWLLGIIEARGHKRPAAPVGEKIPVGQRHSTLVSLAGSMRRRGMDAEEIFAALSVANERRCEPPLEASAIRQMANSVAGLYEPVAEIVPISANGHGSALPPTRFNLTDLGNAERFISDHGVNVRYCHKWGSWLVYDGQRWRVDDRGAVVRLAKETVRKIYREASDAGDEDRRKALAKHAARSESADKIRSMLELAKSEVPVSPDELDADPMLLNVKNGTIDLRAGAPRDHRREDLITKLAPVEYDPAAKAPTWAAALERSLPSEELRAFFKRLCGYAISGDVSEHILAVLYGTGANGKSTILNALLSAVGDYGMQAAPDLLVAKKGSHPTEVADLFGMRLVASIEVEDGSRLAESLVKQLTGGDRVRARKMRQDFWQFDPTHKVFMAANHKPEVRGTDLGIWRRIRLIPFTETIALADQDKRLPEKLSHELPGILRWAVEGCLEWRREGLQAPTEVRKATGSYRAEMDVIGAFLADECEVGADHRAPFKAVYERYAEWCAEGGERPETGRRFNARLKERGRFEARRSGPGGSNEWHGLRLLKKQNPDFAGKLKQGSESSYDSSKNTTSQDNRRDSFSSSVASVGSFTDDQERRIRELVRKGFSEDSARQEVLAADHPVGCECEVCL